MIMLTRPLTAGQQVIQSALRQQAAHPTGHIGGGGHIIVGFWFLNAERAQQRIADRTGRQFKLIWPPHLHKDVLPSDVHKMPRGLIRANQSISQNVELRFDECDW